MATRIKIRGGSSTTWGSVNPILAEKEIGYETDTRKLKVGDGVTEWNSLSYIAGAEAAATTSWGDIDGTLANQTDLINVLNAKIPATEKGMINGVATLDGDGLLSSSQRWSVDWTDIANKPTEYPPQTHTHEGYAAVDSPALTGTPTAPTPEVSDNSTKLATTAHVLSRINLFGLGGTCKHLDSVNIDSADLETGFYYVTTSCTGTLPNSQTEGHLIVLKQGTGTSVHHLWLQNSSARIWHRMWPNTEWGTWVEIYNSDNLTVGGGDADTVDGYNTSESATASTLACRNSSGDLYARLFRSTYSEQSSAPSTSADIAFRNSTTDNYIRFMTSGAFKSWCDSIGISVDGHSHSYAPRPTSSNLPVGCWALCQYMSSSNLSNGSTCSGSLLELTVTNEASNVIAGVDTQVGTWKNISGWTLDSNLGGLCVRIS